MTQQEYEKAILAAKLACADKLHSINSDFETTLESIRSFRKELTERLKNAEDRRNASAKAAHIAYRETRQRIDTEYQSTLTAKREAGVITYRDCLGAVKTVLNFLKQKVNDGIIIPWGEAGAVEIRFKKQAVAVEEGGAL